MHSIYWRNSPCSMLVCHFNQSLCSIWPLEGRFFPEFVPLCLIVWFGFMAFQWQQVTQDSTSSTNTHLQTCVGVCCGCHLTVLWKAVLSDVMFIEYQEVQLHTEHNNNTGTLQADFNLYFSSNIRVCRPSVTLKNPSFECFLLPFSIWRLITDISIGVQEEFP